MNYIKVKSKVFNALMCFCKFVGGKMGLTMGVSLKYYSARKKWPNLKNPKNLSERILSSICSPSFLQYADFADKIKVREYIKSKGLGNILLKQYAVWDSPDDISIDMLPNKFILKPNNTSGGHIYCRDKNIFKLDEAKIYLNKNLLRAKDYFFEPHYLKIEPKIFAEQLLDLGVGKVLTDYKFHCIKGKIADVFIAGENVRGERKYATLDLKWHILPYTKDEYLLDVIPQKPSCLSEMIEYAEELSQDFDFVRVDFYEYNSKVYFSELTFSPWGGYMYSYTDEALAILGDKF